MDKLLAKIEKIVSKLKVEIEHLKLKKHCPFYGMFGGEIECPYLEEGWYTCHDIQIAPSNGDAWCAKHINRSLGGEFSADVIEEKQCKYPSCVNYNPKSESYCCNGCAWDHADYIRLKE